ncbi:branched-chain amino acid transport system ATP-binding protein [Halogranum gelatinilyticum]|uniref:Probable branched-chain amino acid transport ATP-binding protein LivG n=1 Tax=Halogranum gelatinilyticum TaxID=660521 RepID=A0A1G9SVA2_9EURY|nr:ABC transporter ATP-binding protein [Halogranum gelatinilyticum]SDM39398.1 branched-chain amino acid transport system ATP-binding protein [Halogranum gelatinilyticum]
MSSDMPTVTDEDDRGASAVEPTAGDAPPLRVEHLRKTFGGITAVDDTSFEIEQGKITGLIGPNGAGKSTTFNLITGFLSPDSGSVELYGQDITGMAPYNIADRGMVRTFQIARELSEMTVLENMMLAPKHQQGEALWRSVAPGARAQVQKDEQAVLERAWEMLDFFDIDHLAEEYAGNLSGGQRKLLEMARALMTDPDILLLDEPFAGVNPSLEEKLLEHIRELREQGYTFLLVEHDIDLIMENCSRVLVLHQGKLLAEGPPEEIKNDERVIEAYLGGEVE